MSTQPNDGTGQSAPQPEGSQPAQSATAGGININMSMGPGSGYPGGMVLPGGGVGVKSRVVAAILALLIGGIGAHKFYLGKTGLGVLYLIFAWTFIPAIIAFIEGIMFLVQSDHQFSLKQGVPVRAE
jgi:TM2 domain-containing membrane protein YozV